MSITKLIPCEDCGEDVLVTGNVMDDFDGWVCNDCDKKNNPEDYED